MNASYLIRSEIKSFKQALVYLGEERLRKFISLVAITSTQDDKPDSLYSLSIQRARFCELLLSDMNTNLDEGLGFLTGMFSLLDSLFDQPLEELVEKMPIDHMVKSALVTKQGTLGNILSLVKAYENADWMTVIAYRDKLEVSDEKLAKHYDDAIKWTEDLLAIESEYHVHV